MALLFECSSEQQPVDSVVVDDEEPPGLRSFGKHVSLASGRRARPHVRSGRRALERAARWGQGTVASERSISARDARARAPTLALLDFNECARRRASRSPTRSAPEICTMRSLTRRGTSRRARNELRAGLLFEVCQHAWSRSGSVVDTVSPPTARAAVRHERAAEGLLDVVTPQGLRDVVVHAGGDTARGRLASCWLSSQ